MFPNSEMVKALAQDHLQTLGTQAQTQRLLKPQAPTLGQKLATGLRKLAERLEGRPLSPSKPI